METTFFYPEKITSHVFFEDMIVPKIFREFRKIIRTGEITSY